MVGMKYNTSKPSANQRRGADQANQLAQHHTLRPLPHHDGTFERFLSSALVAIITILFSWRILTSGDEQPPRTDKNNSEGPSKTQTSNENAGSDAQIAQDANERGRCKADDSDVKADDSDVKADDNDGKANSYEGKADGSGGKADIDNGNPFLNAADDNGISPSAGQPETRDTRHFARHTFRRAQEEVVCGNPFGESSADDPVERWAEHRPVVPLNRRYRSNTGEPDEASYRYDDPTDTRTSLPKTNNHRVIRVGKNPFETDTDDEELEQTEITYGQGLNPLPGKEEGQDWHPLFGNTDKYSVLSFPGWSRQAVNIGESEPKESTHGKQNANEEQFHAIWRTRLPDRIFEQSSNSRLTIPDKANDINHDSITGDNSTTEDISHRPSFAVNSKHSDNSAVSDLDLRGTPQMDQTSSFMFALPSAARCLPKMDRYQLVPMPADEEMEYWDNDDEEEENADEEGEDEDGRLSRTGFHEVNPWQQIDVPRTTFEEYFEREYFDSSEESEDSEYLCERRLETILEVDEEEEMEEEVTTEEEDDEADDFSDENEAEEEEVNMEVEEEVEEEEEESSNARKSIPSHSGIILQNLQHSSENDVRNGSRTDKQNFISDHSLGSSQRYSAEFGSQFIDNFSLDPFTKLPKTVDAKRSLGSRGHIESHKVLGEVKDIFSALVNSNHGALMGDNQAFSNRTEHPSSIGDMLTEFQIHEEVGQHPEDTDLLIKQDLDSETWMDDRVSMAVPYNAMPASVGNSHETSRNNLDERDWRRTVQSESALAKEQKQIPVVWVSEATVTSQMEIVNCTTLERKMKDSTEVQQNYVEADNNSWKTIQSTDISKTDSIRLDNSSYRIKPVSPNSVSLLDSTDFVKVPENSKVDLVRSVNFPHKNTPESPSTSKAQTESVNLRSLPGQINDSAISSTFGKTSSDRILPNFYKNNEYGYDRKPSETTDVPLQDPRNVQSKPSLPMHLSKQENQSLTAKENTAGRASKPITYSPKPARKLLSAININLENDSAVSSAPRTNVDELKRKLASVRLQAPPLPFPDEMWNADKILEKFRSRESKLNHIGYNDLLSEIRNDKGDSSMRRAKSMSILPNSRTFAISPVSRNAGRLTGSVANDDLTGSNDTDTHNDAYLKSQSMSDLRISKNLSVFTSNNLNENLYESELRLHESLQNLNIPEWFQNSARKHQEIVILKNTRSVEDILSSRLWSPAEATQHLDLPDSGPHTLPKPVVIAHHVSMPAFKRNERRQQVRNIADFELPSAKLRARPAPSLTPIQTLSFDEIMRASKCKAEETESNKDEELSVDDASIVHSDLSKENDDTSFRRELPPSHADEITIPILTSDRELPTEQEEIPVVEDTSLTKENEAISLWEPSHPNEAILISTSVQELPTKQDKKKENIPIEANKASTKNFKKGRDLLKENDVTSLGQELQPSQPNKTVIPISTSKKEQPAEHNNKKENIFVDENKPLTKDLKKRRDLSKENEATSLGQVLQPSHPNEIIISTSEKDLPIKQDKKTENVLVDENASLTKNLKKRRVRKTNRDEMLQNFEATRRLSITSTSSFEEIYPYSVTEAALVRREGLEIRNETDGMLAENMPWDAAIKMIHSRNKISDGDTDKEAKSSDEQQKKTKKSIKKTSVKSELMGQTKKKKRVAKNNEEQNEQQENMYEEHTLERNTQRTEIEEVRREDNLRQTKKTKSRKVADQDGQLQLVHNWLNDSYQEPVTESPATKKKVHKESRTKQKEPVPQTNEAAEENFARRAANSLPVSEFNGIHSKVATSQKFIQDDRVSDGVEKSATSKKSKAQKDLEIHEFFGNSQESSVNTTNTTFDLMGQIRTSDERKSSRKVKAKTPKDLDDSKVRNTVDTINNKEFNLCNSQETSISFTDDSLVRPKKTKKKTKPSDDDETRETTASILETGNPIRQTTLVVSEENSFLSPIAPKKSKRKEKLAITPGESENSLLAHETSGYSLGSFEPSVDMSLDSTDSLRLKKVRKKVKKTEESVLIENIGEVAELNPANPGISMSSEGSAKIKILDLDGEVRTPKAKRRLRVKEPQTADDAGSGNCSVPAKSSIETTEFVKMPEQNRTRTKVQKIISQNGNGSSSVDQESKSSSKRTPSPGPSKLTYSTFKEVQESTIFDDVTTKSQLKIEKKLHSTDHESKSSSRRTPSPGPSKLTYSTFKEVQESTTSGDVITKSQSKTEKKLHSTDHESRSSSRRTPSPGPSKLSYSTFKEVQESTISNDVVAKGQPKAAKKLHSGEETLAANATQPYRGSTTPNQTRNESSHGTERLRSDEYTNAVKPPTNKKSSARSPQLSQQSKRGGQFVAFEYEF